MTIRRMGSLALVGVVATTCALAEGSISAAAPGGQIIKAAEPYEAGRYVVTLKDGAGVASAEAVQSAATSLTAKYNGILRTTYSTVTKGFAVRGMSERDARRLAADPAVLSVREVGTLRGADEQPNPTWGLDRVDQREKALDKKYIYNATGEGVTIYDIDSGINKDHSDFEGRASYGPDFIDNDQVAQDCHGHGTHTAGTAASKTYGIAKKAKIVGVRIFKCDNSGPDELLIDAVEWVTKNAKKPAVVNMSIAQYVAGVGDKEIQASIQAGINYVAAAGNDSKDACGTSPARIPELLTVGAIDQNDGRAIFSNYGSCLDLFAPGTNITSLSNTGNGTANMQGTSMAAPHVTGAVALYLQSHPNANQAEVNKAILDAATPGKVGNAGSGSPNKLLYTKDFGGGGNPGPTCGKQSNGDDVSIPDAGAAVTSTIKFSGCGGSGATSSSVEVAIAHPYRGDVSVDLIAPSGKVYSLKTANPSDSAANVNQTFTVNLAGEAKDGDWKLSVKDAYKYDSGKIDSWSLTA